MSRRGSPTARLSVVVPALNEAACVRRAVAVTGRKAL